MVQRAICRNQDLRLLSFPTTVDLQWPWIALYFGRRSSNQSNDDCPQNYNVHLGWHLGWPRFFGLNRCTPWVGVRVIMEELARIFIQF
jgi:hypothetical protein